MAFLVGICLCGGVFAQDVNLKWDPIPGATSYEFEVSRNGESVVHRKVEGKGTTWGVKLPPGVYVFKIRAIDWSGQPGEWSAPSPLVSSPPPPEWRHPPEGSTFAVAELNRGIPLRWNGVSGVKRYQVTVKHDGVSLLSQTIESTGILFKARKPGDYTAVVESVIEVVGDLPPGLESKIFVGDPSKTLTFHAEGREIIALPSPRIDPTEAASSFVSISPFVSGAWYSLTHKTFNGSATPSTKTNTGFHITGAVRLSRDWALKLGAWIESSQLNPDVFVYSGERTMPRFDLGVGWRPRRAPKLELRVLVGSGQLPYVRRIGLTYTLTPCGFERVGAGFGVPLVIFPWGKIALEASLFGLLSRFFEADSIRNGLLFEGGVLLDAGLTRKLDAVLRVGLTSMYFNTQAQDLSRDEFVASLGLVYHFGR